MSRQGRRQENWTGAVDRDGVTEAVRRAFILQHTRLRRPPLAPELRLHLAEAITPIWRLAEQELGEASAPPFWAFPWAGGQAIARYVLDHPTEVTGRRVLDFAAGSGLCAIAAMRAGAASALAADIAPSSRVAVALNARANGLQIDFTGCDLLDDAPPPTDLILAGDICYEELLAARVLAWLRAAHEQGARVLIGDPSRAYFPRESLLLLTEYRVATTLDLEGATAKQAGVFTFPPTA